MYLSVMGRHISLTLRVTVGGRRPPDASNSNRQGGIGSTRSILAHHGSRKSDAQRAATECIRAQNIFAKFDAPGGISLDSSVQL
jgi:hypothetical protein